MAVAGIVDTRNWCELMRTPEWRQCQRKLAYSSRKSAADRAREMNYNVPRQVHLHAYTCPHCRMFHIGHQRP